MTDRHPLPNRREFLRRTTLLAAALTGARPAVAVAAPAEELITRVADPANLEFPFATLDSFLTPTESFYVRNHYDVPKLDARSYRLEVKGLVRRPLTLSLDDLRKLSATTRPLTLECAGNGRAMLNPKQKGVQWELGAVSTAEWSGVPLAAVLEMAGVAEEAVEVILDGADRGDPKKEIQPPPPVSFSRSLPLNKALRPEVMLAWAMNGKPLTVAHGYPLRAVVGGWYGMASVKWLTRVIVTREPYRGFDQTIDYAVWGRDEHGLDRLTPVAETDVKASIARPAAGETVPTGKLYRVHGAAWAGESEVSKVEVSADNGRSWAEATLLGKPVPWCWRLWEWRWERPAAGAVLMARATDRRGRVQPLQHDPRRRNYMISFVRPTSVLVQ